MNLGALIPIVAIIATAWVMVTYLNHHYRQQPGKRAGGEDRGPAEDPRGSARLAHENELLKLTVERLEDRLAVLERIATDPAERTAREIEELRRETGDRR